MRPWAIPDKWIENTDPPWDFTDTYDRRYHSGPQAGQLIPLPRDDYVPPSTSGPGSGYSLPADVGLAVTLKAGNPNQSLSPGLFFPIDLPRAGGGPFTGGDKYRENIATCSSVSIPIGTWLTFEPGNMVGPTQQGVNALIGQDPNAYFDTGTNTVQNSCAPSCATYSPRIVAIPIFHTDVFDAGQTTGRVDILIVNILGFFVEQMQGNNVVGYFMTIPGLIDDGAPGVGTQSAFQRTVLLVR